MNRFKINVNNYKGFIILILTFFQLTLMFYYFNLKKDNISKEVISNTPINMSFNELSNSLNNIENLKILEIEDLDNEWYTKILITGEKDKIIKAISELEDFKIYNYDITGNKGILSVIMELYK